MTKWNLVYHSDISSQIGVQVRRRNSTEISLRGATMLKESPLEWVSGDHVVDLFLKSLALLLDLIFDVAVFVLGLVL